jgi:alkyl sulfatase BDS1-like metallo-beta-lactamase superfamily hydrolase
MGMLDALARASAEEASALLAGADASDLVEAVRALPDDARKARGLRVAIGFRLTGRPDDEVDRYVVRLEDGAASVLSGGDADAVGREQRNATVTCGAHDFLRLATGHLSPVSGVLRGRLKVRGDKAAALRLAGAFDIVTVPS